MDEFKYVLSWGIYSDEAPTSVWDTLEEAKAQLPRDWEWGVAEANCWTASGKLDDSRWTSVYTIYKLPYKPSTREYNRE